MPSQPLFRAGPGECRREISRSDSTGSQNCRPVTWIKGAPLAALKLGEKERSTFYKVHNDMASKKHKLHRVIYLHPKRQ
jgi:hypothetical protein